jgi:phosphohistidine phosphatase
MKTLILMRHAKSSLDSKNKEDRDRPLSKKGKKNAFAMAKVLEETERIPEVILASAAARARHTSEILTEALHFRGDMHYLNSLYQGEVENYLNEIQQVSDSVDTLLVIGHNPILESFLQMLSGKVEALPTASLAFLQLPIASWGELNLETEGQLLEIRTPKDA